MKAVHGRKHLGVRTSDAYTDAEAKQSHDLFEEHVRQLLQGRPIKYQECNIVTVSPADMPENQITVFKDGRMQPLLGQRQAEFQHLCSIIDSFVGSSSAPSAPAPAAAVAVAPPSLKKQKYPSAPAGGGSAAPAPAPAAAVSSTGPVDRGASATPHSLMRHVAVAFAIAAMLLCTPSRHVAVSVAIAVILLCAVALFRRRHC
jgi:hypothetical protein